MSKTIESLKENEEDLENNLITACKLLSRFNRSLQILIYAGLGLCIMSLALFFSIEQSFRLYGFVISFNILMSCLMLKIYKKLDRKDYIKDLNDYKHHLFFKLDITGNNKKTLPALFAAYDKFIEKGLVYLERCNLSMVNLYKIKQLNIFMYSIILIIYMLFFWMEKFYK
jgi:hypothetical protein